MTWIKREVRTANSVYVAIADVVVNQRSVLLINFVPNGQESTSKSATVHRIGWNSKRYRRL